MIAVATPRRARGARAIRRAHAAPATQRGVTLVELVAVIVILAVVSTIGARMIVQPVAALIAGGDNARLGELASQATRRLDDDFGIALANSVRVATSGATTYLELVPVQAVGRYRKRAAATAPHGDPLDFDANDTRFDVLGPLDAFGAGASVVIHNLGTPDADVYVGNNRRANAVLSGGALSFASSQPFPLDSPSGRFAIVGSPVTWVCRPAADGGGTLVRITGYGFHASQPTDDTAAPLASGTRAVAARGVAACSIVQDAAQANLGLVRMTLELTEGGATARLARQHSVDNTP